MNISPHKKGTSVFSMKNIDAFDFHLRKRVKTLFLFVQHGMQNKEDISRNKNKKTYLHFAFNQTK